MKWTIQQPNFNTHKTNILFGGVNEQRWLTDLAKTMDTSRTIKSYFTG
jgi:hypothetical protein